MRCLYKDPELPENPASARPWKHTRVISQDAFLHLAFLAERLSGMSPYLLAAGLATSFGKPHFHPLTWTAARKAARPGGPTCLHGHCPSRSCHRQTLVLAAQLALEERPFLAECPQVIGPFFLFKADILQIIRFIYRHLYPLPRDVEAW